MNSQQLFNARQSVLRTLELSEVELAMMDNYPVLEALFGFKGK